MIAIQFCLWFYIPILALAFCSNWEHLGEWEKIWYRPIFGAAAILDFILFCLINAVHQVVA